MRQTITVLAALAMTASTAMAQKTIEVTVENTLKMPRPAQPVIVSVAQLGMNVRTAVVKDGNREIASQLDDLNGDGICDELCFITNIDAKEKKTFKVTVDDKGTQRRYKPQVYAEMMLMNRKIKATNKQDIYISNLTVDKGVNPYWSLHHHGAAFENEMVAYRIYFDHRQTVDIYGKYRMGLELRETQFYPDNEQKANGYGDDVLWVGSTFGVGALRGWDGKAPQMLSDVEHRTQKIVARGPLRTIVDVVDEGWNTMNEGKAPIDMTTRYTLYAGRRDCMVDITFAPSAKGYQFATGIINVKNSREYNDNKGLRGCWGTDWPVSEKDSAGHKRETVGLGICIPHHNVVKVLDKNKDNYPFVVGNAADRLSYGISFCSANEEFGFDTAKEWFEYLKDWKKDLSTPVKVTVKAQ